MKCVMCGEKLDETPWYKQYYRCPKCYRIFARSSVMEDETDKSAQLIEEVRA